MNDVLLWTIASAIGFALCFIAVWVNFQGYSYARGTLSDEHVTIARGQVRRSFLRWIVFGVFLAAGISSEVAPSHSGWIVKGLIASAIVLVLNEVLDAFDRY